MSLVRGNSYATAGIADTETEKFQINRSVFILDATAGQGYDAYDGADAEIPAEGYKHVRRSGVTVARGLVLRIIALILTALLILFVINTVRIRKLAYSVSVMEEQVRLLSESNRELDQEVIQARDLTRISYMAVQTLGMIPVEEAEVHYITVPNTRPFEIRGAIGNENTQ